MTPKIDRRALMASGAALGFLATAVRAEDTAVPSGPPSVEIYAASPMIDKVALSPDGKRVAIISQKGDDKILICMDVNGENPQRVHLGPVKIRQIFWADGDHVIICDSQTTALPQFAGRLHEVRLARVLNLKTNKLRTLFDNMENFHGMVVGPVYRVTIDGQVNLIASNYRLTDGFNRCLFRFPLNGGLSLPVCEGSSDTEGFVIAPDGYVVAYSDFDEFHKEWVLYYNKAPRGKSEHFQVIYRMKEALDYPSLEGLAHDGASVVVYFAKGEAKGEYHEISADGTIGPSLDTSDYISTTPLFHPVTWRHAGFSHNDDWVTYDYTDPLLKKLAIALPTIMGEEYRTSIADFADDPRKMILYGESADDAGSFYFADLGTGAFDMLGQNYSGLTAGWITQKKGMTYKAADGLDIHAYLTLPPGRDAKNLPLIVLPHGGPQARDYIDFDWQTQTLASRGYTVLQPNYRGSAGYGSNFVDAGHGEFGRKMQTDLSDGVRDLIKQGLVDPKRVAILGASYGGYAALAGATLDPGIYKCAVAIAGVTDPKSFVDFVAEKNASRDSSSVLYWKQFMGDPKTYDDISPVKQAAHASCPILLIHGTDDTVVPIDQSRRMESALKRAGKPVEFVTYKGQDHWETVGSSRIEMMKLAIAFLNTHNPA